MAKKKEIKMIDTYPRTIETFYQVGDYELGRMKTLQPSCFNGVVSFRKYKVTVEIIDEPTGLLEERLEKLWCESDNHHHYLPLKNAAASIGYIFTGEFGCDRPIKK